MPCLQQLLFDSVGRHAESGIQWKRSCDLWPTSLRVLNAAILHTTVIADWAAFDDLVQIARERGLYRDQTRLVASFVRSLRDPDPKFVQTVVARTSEEVAQTGTLIQPDALNGLCMLGRTEEAFDLVDQASFAYMFDREGRWPREQDFSAPSAARA